MLNKVILMGRRHGTPSLSIHHPIFRSALSDCGGQALFQARRSASTDFINIVAWRSTAEFICKYFSKEGL